jgi:FMN-dependent NADH-azoreductase
MPVLLQIDSSPMGDFSISRSLTGTFARRWAATNPGGRILYRDLAATTMPVIDAAWVEANYTPKESRSREQEEMLALSSELTAELLEADEYVIGVPMHNWGPSSSFKLWADQIVRFGETMAITPNGLKGMLGSKRATFVIAAGRSYGPGSVDAGSNYLQPWLRTFFGNLGMTEMRFVFADGAAAVRYGRIDRAGFLAPYTEAIEALFAEVASAAVGV